MLGPATGGTTTGPGGQSQKDDNRILYIVVVLVIVSPAGAVLIFLCCRCVRGRPSIPKQGILEFSTVNVVSYPPDAGVGFGATNCSICQGRFGEGERVSVLPICRHIHHPQCLQNRTSSRGLYCPDCQQDYSFWDGARPSPDFLP
ncbi:hypothetical protein RHMOL_Rhmol02G0222600 [Rhododendron molle]|uniref:Uncharacterized protein n=1 Tax=Rhododendron molle TaxID=49168 RepID=A0ACC0PTA3_RHOML|nr:hypothetical protein RHMOL_Rhmol02G0222600 [Rhododendron molle]